MNKAQAITWWEAADLNPEGVDGRKVISVARRIEFMANKQSSDGDRIRELAEDLKTTGRT